MDDEVGQFVNLKTGARLSLGDAVEAGLVTAEYENGQDSVDNGGSVETKTYAVNSVVDQVRAQQTYNIRLEVTTAWRRRWNVCYASAP